MIMQPFSLYQIKTTNGRYGEVTEEILLDTIEVAISQQHMKSYTNEILYLIKVVTGLTKYQDFTEGQKYFIKNDKCKYDIQSFIIGRFTQLQLKEVIV